MVIRQSFLFLLKEQVISKITVADICRLAEINRATFYRHYENQYSILNELELDLLQRIPLPAGEQTPTAAFLAAALGLREQQAEWTPLLASDGDPGLALKLFHFLEAHLPISSEERPGRFLLRGLSGLLLDWMTAGFEEPAEQLAEFAAPYFTT